MTPRKGKMQIVYDFFKKEIEDGKYALGELFPTEAEIAQQFSTSRPTIAKALNLLKKEGYVERKAGYGTSVIKDSTQSEDHEYKFGILIPNIKDTEIFEPIFGEIARQANTNNFTLVVDENNFSLMWGENTSFIEVSKDYAEQIAHNYAEQGVDGVFFTPLELFSEFNSINNSICNIFTEAQIPVVLLDSDIVSYPNNSPFDLVSMCQITAGYKVAKHLIEKGCKKIVFLSAENVASTVHQRFIGARLAVEESSLDNCAIEKIIALHSARATAERIIASDNLCSLICYNDAVAAKLIPEFTNLGITIPQDLKIIGFDDVKYSKLLSIPLSSYTQPCISIGRAAVNVMLQRMKNPEGPPVRHLIEGKLVERASTQNK